MLIWWVPKTAGLQFFFLVLTNFFHDVLRKNFDLFKKKYLKNGSFVTNLDACTAQKLKNSAKTGYHGKHHRLQTQILKSKGQEIGTREFLIEMWVGL